MVVQYGSAVVQAWPVLAAETLHAVAAKARGAAASKLPEAIMAARTRDKKTFPFIVLKIVFIYFSLA
jgi:hypothetical protein